MQLPRSFIESLLNAPGFDREAFEKAHDTGEQVTSIRLNPLKVPGASEVPSPGGPARLPASMNRSDGSRSGGDLGEAVPWSRYGYYLRQRPSFTFDPLFHAGCYYVQEASSMFLEQALLQSVDLTVPLKVLDLCAAPGGKSTHIQSLISGKSLLVCNEVIKSRSRVLADNIIKWGSRNVMVTHNDPAAFRKLENFFDVMVVDAPCSGSGLFRKDESAIQEWSPGNVHLCSRRQQRILADAWPSLKKGGILIYCTCSYSTEENEDVVDWLTETFTAEKIKLNINEDRKIYESAGGYRFWPDKTKGEGFFISCLRKNEGGDYRGVKSKTFPDSLTKREISVVQEWLRPTEDRLIKAGKTIYALPVFLVADYYYLSSHLNSIYQGTAAGELIRDKMIPEHALALSDLVNRNIRKMELDEKTAIEFLQKKIMHIHPADKGWWMVTYKGHNLGWINVLSNRINNYYPHSLRILKDR